jgi:hypothetical protein
MIFLLAKVYHSGWEVGAQLALSHQFLEEKIQILSSFFTPSTEMEFLDIRLTEDSSLLLRAIHSLFYWQIFQTTILYTKKYARKLVSLL